MLDLDGNPKDRFSHDVAHLYLSGKILRNNSLSKVPTIHVNCYNMKGRVDLHTLAIRKPEDHWSCKRSPDILT